MKKQLNNVKTIKESCRECPNFNLYSVRSEGLKFSCDLIGLNPKKLIPNEADHLRFIHQDCPLKDAREQGVMVGISVFLINDRNQILVGERADGSWGLPGGGMDAGETLERAGANLP